MSIQNMLTCRLPAELRIRYGKPRFTRPINLNVERKIQHNFPSMIVSQEHFIDLFVLHLDSTLLLPSIKHRIPTQQLVAQRVLRFLFRNIISKSM